MEKKIRLGVDFFFTTAIYDVGFFEAFVKKVAHFKIPMIVGITLLKSVGMARYINKHIEGACIPDTVIDRLMKASDKQRASIEIAGTLFGTETALPGNTDYSDRVGEADSSTP